MSASSDKRSKEFLEISSQFKLGALVTESSHPVTANLSDVARKDISAGLKLLFDVDNDVLNKYREFVASGRAGKIAETILQALKNGGRIFFTGCGATGRLSILLDSIWRDFWRQQERFHHYVEVENFENRTVSVMSGGDYALVKSVEGFEDFPAFGRKQMRDLKVSASDVVFAITEGGETPFVIGTAWEAVDAGAKVYFIYNNPDDILCATVERSREIIQESRIEKINLTTGPMAITGSTRMQATSIQLCVLLTVLEMVVAELTGRNTPDIPQKLLGALEELLVTLKSGEVIDPLARLVALEESVYRSGHRNNYFSVRLGIDVLTDTTERSPTYCTPSFRKFDDPAASESWAFLFVPQTETTEAWRYILKREPRCIEWSEQEIRDLVGDEKFPRTCEVIRHISRPELMRFRIGWDGLPYRPPGPGDSAISILGDRDRESLLSPSGFQHMQLSQARQAGAKAGLIFIARKKFLCEPRGVFDDGDFVSVEVPLPDGEFLLDCTKRIGIKLLLNAFSTCTMVRLRRVMGNYMIWVAPSNLKLIDRATRYISRLANLEYEAANRLLFDVIEYVEPRMKSDQAYPPVVAMAVLRAKGQLSNEQAEAELKRFL